jgi:hypothetical protein
MDHFKGYHVEWNLGCPGGWEYQRMAQVRGKLCWNRIKEYSNIKLDLEFDHPLFQPVTSFIDMLIRYHRKKFDQQNPFILIVAEKETLDTVTENIHLAEYLNRMDGVRSALTSPEEIEATDDEIFFQDQQVTVIFMDMNCDVLLEIGRRESIDGLLTAINQGIVVNPRGMEPIGDKGVFEAVTGEFGHRLHTSTINHTPWTRLFYDRSTTGPEGEALSDLVEWVRRHQQDVILKPVHGYSGKGILVGPFSNQWDMNVQEAMKDEAYIVQSFIPEDLWSEEFAWLDLEKEEIFLKKWQTDFRCLINDQGLIGFLARYGGIPTNVGAGGGNQSLALLKGDISVEEAIKQINGVILDLGYDTMREIQEEVDKKGIELGHTYLKGPTPTTLRPRIINQNQIIELEEYSLNLWQDLVLLEQIWREGKLDHLIQMGEKELEIARKQPWRGSEALVASDGLFCFNTRAMTQEY